MSITFCPIDIPKLEYDSQKLYDFFINRCGTHSDHNGPKVSQLDQIMSWWNYLIVRSSKISEQEQTPTSWHKYEINDRTWSWDEEFKKEFPYLIERVENLPFEYITYVGLFSNHKNIPLHKDRIHIRNPENKMVGHLTLNDKNYVENALSVYNSEIKNLEPCSYRFFLYGPKNESFFISPTNDEKDIVYTDMPDDTDCFVFDGTNIFHGAKIPPYGKPKILMYISGFFNKEKHSQLLQQSIEKYENYVVRF